MSFKIGMNVNKIQSFALTLVLLSVAVFNVANSQEEAEASEEDLNGSIISAGQTESQSATQTYVSIDLDDETWSHKTLMALSWLLRPSEFESSWPLYAYSLNVIQQTCNEATNREQIGKHRLGYGVVATQRDEYPDQFVAHPLIYTSNSENTSFVDEASGQVTLEDVCRIAANSKPDVLFATQRPILNKKIALRLSKDVKADAKIKTK